MTTTLQDPAAISIEEAGRLLGVCKRTAQRYAASGQLPSIKLGGKVFVPVHRFRAMLDGEEVA